jgi:hypothetical protein
MTIDQLIELASASAQALEPSDVETVAQQLDCSTDDICDAFAKRVAQGYLRGEYSFTAADAAMNALFGFAYPVTGAGLPSLASRVYEAFDEGEYVHAGEPEDSQGEVRTKGLLARISELSDA